MQAGLRTLHGAPCSYCHNTHLVELLIHAGEEVGLLLAAAGSGSGGGNVAALARGRSRHLPQQLDAAVVELDTLLLPLLS